MITTEIKSFADIKCDVINALVKQETPVLKVADRGEHVTRYHFQGRPVLPNNEDFIGLEQYDLSITIPTMSFWCTDSDRELTIEGQIEIWDFEGGHRYELELEQVEQIKRLLENGLSTDY